ncbi:Protein CYP-14A3 [Aphelenchoides avenae]|nr:Protein CYP-14A3 [Aphelenchus avenae]
MSKVYGPVFTLFLPLPTVMLMDFESIEEALRKKGAHFVGKLQAPPLTFFSYVPNGGIFPATGENWREQKRVSLNILRHLGMGKAEMEHTQMQSVQALLEQLDGVKDKSQVDLSIHVKRCVGNTLNRIFFGFAYDDTNVGRLDRLLYIIDTFFIDLVAPEMLAMQAYPALRYAPRVRTVYQRFKKNMNEYFDFILDEVEKQENTFNQDTIPTNFVHAYLKEIAAGANPRLTRDEMISVTADLWSGGIEAPAVTILWAMMFMMKWPHVQRRAQDEIDSVVGRDRLPEMADKPNLPYVSALIHEIFRFANVATIETHLSTAEQTLNGHVIPNGTLILPQYCSVMKSDPVFEDPEVFRPERFLVDDGKSLNKALIARTIPFGIGQRQCPGEGLARMQQFLVVSALLQRYTFVACGEVDLSPHRGALRRPHDFRCSIVPRSKEKIQ